MVTNKFWSEEELDFLKSNYKNKTNKELAEKLGKTNKSVNVKLFNLKLKRDIKYSAEELDFMRKNYKLMSNKEIAKLLGKNPDCIGTKLLSMGLKKTAEDIKNNYNRNRPTKKYTEQELNYIINNYKTKSNDDIGAELGVTREAIRKKLKRMGLKKTPEEIKINYKNNKHKMGFHGIFHPLYGTHRPDELKNKLSNLYKNKTFEERHGIKKAKEIKQKMSIALLGNIPWNTGLSREELLKHYKNGFANVGKTWELSEETCKRISIANTGKKRTEEHKRKQSEMFIKLGMSKMEKNPNWQGGKSFEPYCPNFSKSFKFQIRAREAFMCIKCGMREEDSIKLFKRKLDCHHINYDKKLSTKENCCALCVRCHTGTEYNRVSWIKFFQSILTERYNYEYDQEGNIIQNIKLEQEKL